MQSNAIETKTESVIANVLTKEIKQKASRLTKMRESLNNYHERQAKAPPVNTSSVNTTNSHVGGFDKEDPRERIIVDWAKEHYQDIHSIKDFPFHQYEMKPKITSGVVYLVLKKHSFIAQNETTEYRVMDAYFRFNGNLQFMCEDLGLGVWIVAKTIESLGYSPRWHEYKESRYVTRRSDGMGAEKKFKELVPEAVDMNENYRENNPMYDFIVEGKTVDVKELTVIFHKSTGNSFYEFKFPRDEEMRADFYCIFLCHKKELRMNGSFDILLVPKEVLPNHKKQMQISPKEESNSHQFFYQFQVAPHALAYMLGCEL